MNPRDQSFSGALKAAFHELMKGVNTSIPGHIVTFNPANQLAQIQIGLERNLVTGGVQIPRVIEDVPVHFAGGDYTLEFEVGQGTEGVIFFSQRCIDGWKNSGGVASNPLARFFDMQDCYFVPGVRSQPNAIQGFQNNGIRIRNKSGNQFAWLKNDGSIDFDNGAGHIRISASGVVTINGVTIHPNGDVDTPAALRNQGVNAGKGHDHGGVERGGSRTDPLQ